MSNSYCCRLAVYFAFLFCVVNLPQTYGGYILTAPNVFFPGRTESICVSVHDLKSDSDVKVLVNVTIYIQTFRYSSVDQPKELHGKSIDNFTLTLKPSQNELSGCGTITAPESLSQVHQLLITINGSQQISADDVYTFNNSRRVSYRQYTTNSITFIQTDKPVYKPGQAVKFRILTLDGMLKPLQGDIDEVYVESPSDVRVEQWKNVATRKGLGNFQFQLSEEPEMGEWTITVTHGDHKETQTFQVDEYVLPKYEVTITPPTFLTLESKHVPVTLCAKYTYGEPVKGLAFLEACLRQGYSWRWGLAVDIDANSVYCALNQVQLDTSTGCATINMTRESLGYHTVDDVTYGTMLAFKGHVIEKGTDVRLNASDASTPFYKHDIKLEIKGRDSFKPGIPFNGKVLVTYQDDKPAAGKSVSISVDNYSKDRRYSKNYTSDSNGFVHFTLPPVKDERTSFTIRAQALGYEADRWGWGVPTSSQSVKSWFSPSGSYLQFMPAEQSFECGSTANLDLVYTTNSEQDVTLSVVVVGPGNIANYSQHVMTLSTQTKVGSVEESGSSWDTSEIDYSWWYPIIFYDAPLVEKIADKEGSTTPKPSTTTTDAAAGDKANKAREVKAIPSVASYYGTVSLSLPIAASMSPGAQLLIYYVTKTGEIVSDNLEINVLPCTANKVSMAFNKEKGLPDDDVTMSLSASPSSLCAYGTVDKSVFLKGGDNQLSQDTITNMIRKYQITAWSGVYETDDYCDKKLEEDMPKPILRPTKVGGGDEDVDYDLDISIDDSRVAPPITATSPTRPTEMPEPPPYIEPVMRVVEKRSIYMPHSRAVSDYVDAKQSFTDSGVIVLTDLDLESRPCYRERSYPVYSLAGNVGGDPSGQPVPMAMMVEDANVRTAVDPAADIDGLPKISVRKYFPETWLWDLVVVNEEGQAEVKSKLPHTITEWIGNAMCISEEDGLGVSGPASITTFQTFFVSATIPYSAVRGETIPIPVTVFNYLSDCIPVRMRMKSSADYNVIGDSSFTSCVCGKDSVTNDFMVQLNKIGDVNLTITSLIVSNDGICADALQVSADLVGTQDAVIRPLIVEAEGAERSYSVSEFICKDSDEDEITKDIELPLPGEDTLVRDSARSYISVVGDIMGPALSNLDNLLQMPYGCGEQNMVGFAPNVFVLQYLEAASKDTDLIREKAVRHMKSGYQREMNYRHNDGSYSAFGPSGERNGSIWLTAFVVKCFAQASPYIYVDKAQQMQSVQFFRDHQRPDGCFPEVGMVHSSYMKGGSSLTSGGSSSAPLTAFILLSMMEAGLNSTDESVKMGMECLNTQPINNDYTLSLVAYANAMYDPTSDTAMELFGMLNEHAIDNGKSKHWKASPDSDDYDKDRTCWYRPVSADVETTAYALLTTTLLTEDKLNDGLPIVRWLSSQRNQFGGFGSTQDTVIGLQALSQFAQFVITESQDLDIVVKYAKSMEDIARFNVNEDNSVLYQEEMMSQVAPVTAKISGSGCFLLQANVKYNIYTDMKAEEAFATTVEDFRSSTGNNPCKQRKIHLCTRYNGPGKASNMAVIHVRMVSGWKADEDVLKQMLKGQQYGLKRYDVEKDNSIQLYFDQLTTKRKCFGLEIQRVLEVEDPKPAVVTVYDYYKKELNSETTYEIFTSFCPTKNTKVRTKQDLPEVSALTFLTSMTQQRMPSAMAFSNPDLMAEAIPPQDDGTSCPICYASASQFNITEESICQFSNIYKVNWRAKSHYPLTVMADLRPIDGKTKFNKVFVKYELPEDCFCVTMFNAEKGDKLAIMGNWEKDVRIKNHMTLKLGADQVVLPIASGVERALFRTSKHCST